MSKQRVGRTTYQYNYRLSVDVQGTQLNDVNVYVSCDAPGTTLVDDIAEFGKDIGLLDSEAPGCQGQYTIQVQATMKNQSSSAFTGDTTGC